MTYASTRDSEQMRLLQPSIGEFIVRYAATAATGQRRTLFLFPGGMGSQLLRAGTAYKAAAATQTFRYETVWLTIGSLLGDALDLKMNLQADGYHDLDDRIVIAKGAVEFLGLGPYDDFTNWCDQNGIDWFVFGWDWRRRLDETVDFFIATFLPAFRQAVMTACNSDPLANFVLLGHSFGGMFANLAARSADPILAGMSSVVTVASPFYGYDGQIHRYFEGCPYVNQLGVDDVVATISSFPGCYTLLYCDAVTYETDAVALANDPKFPLAQYPSMDSANATEISDPYNPMPLRYPTGTGFSVSELAYALSVYRQLVAPLPAALAPKFYSVRGVQTGGGATDGNITWGFVPGNFKPSTGGSPVRNGPEVAGDGTLPAWSTRLAKPDMNPPTTVSGDIDHMFMMESPLVQQALATILGLP